MILLAAPQKLLQISITLYGDTELVSVPFFLFFVCGRAFDHCVKVSFSFRNLPGTLVPRDFLFFDKCINRFKFCRDIFPLTFRFCMLPGVEGALSPAASRGLLPPGFRGPKPLSAFPLFTFLCHDLLQHRRCLFNAGQSFSFTA